VSSHDSISQVNGMLRLHLGLEDDAAWSLLVRLSQNTNRKLRDVARHLENHLLNQAPLPDDLRAQLRRSLAARTPAAR